MFDDTLLFDIDKFSGYDRIETGTRVNVGLQYTFQANSGGMRASVPARASIWPATTSSRNPGTLVDPDTSARARLRSTSPTAASRPIASDYVLGCYLAPFVGVPPDRPGRFDEGDLALRRADAMAEFNYGPLLARAIYTLLCRRSDARRLDKDQQDILGQLGLRLTDRWSVARLACATTSTPSMRTARTQLQLKYADECFVLTATYTETFIDNPTRDLKPDRTVMLRFELKYLGEFSYKTDALDHVFGDQPADQVALLGRQWRRGREIAVAISPCLCHAWCGKRVDRLETRDTLRQFRASKARSRRSPPHTQPSSAPDAHAAQTSIAWPSSCPVEPRAASRWLLPIGGAMMLVGLAAGGVACPDHLAPGIVISPLRRRAPPACSGHRAVRSAAGARCAAGPGR